MKRLLISIFVLLFVSFVSAEDIFMSANEVLRNLDPSHSTSIQINEYKPIVIGKHIKGTGTVLDVEEVMLRKLVKQDQNIKRKKDNYVYEKQYKIEIYVGDKKSISNLDYNVKIMTLQDPRILKVGQLIKFEGDCDWVGTSNRRVPYIPLISLNNVKIDELEKINDVVKNDKNVIKDDLSRKVELQSTVNDENTKKIFKNEPKGFREFKWGEAINNDVYSKMKCKDYGKGTPNPVYVCEHEKDSYSDYSGFEIRKITYIWWNGKLWSGMVYIYDIQNINNVKKMLMEKYNMSGERIVGEDTIITLKYEPRDERAKYRLVMRSIKLDKERENLGLKNE